MKPARRLFVSHAFVLCGAVTGKTATGSNNRPCVCCVLDWVVAASHLTWYGSSVKYLTGPAWWMTVAGKHTGWAFGRQGAHSNDGMVPVN
jgi:hypothetical protein